MKRSSWFIGLIFLGFSLQITLWGDHFENYKPLQPGIPAKAHFVYGLWDTKPMPKMFKDNLQKWKQQGWEVVLWGKADVEALLELPQYSTYRTTYYGVSRSIQKADLARYLIILHEGGFYFDLDCQPTAHSLFQRVSNILPDSKNIFFIETVTTPEFAAKTAELYLIRQGIPETCQRVANFAFGAEMGSDLLKQILQLACYRCEKSPIIICDYDVLYTTGPDCVTEAINNSDESLNLIKNTYRFLQHRATGTWRNNSDVPVPAKK